MCVGVDECIIIELCINPHQSFISIECPKDSFLSLLKAVFYALPIFVAEYRVIKSKIQCKARFIPTYTIETYTPTICLILSDKKMKFKGFSAFRFSLLHSTFELNSKLDILYDGNFWGKSIFFMSSIVRPYSYLTRIQIISKYSIRHTCILHNTLGITNKCW